MEEREDSLVAPLVLLLNLSVLQVGASRHPAVDLSREGLDVVRNRQVVFEALNVIGGLVLGSEHGHRDVHVLSVVGVDHSGVALNSGLEDLVVLAGEQGSDLSTPAVANDGPLEALTTRGELVGLLDVAGDLGEGVWRGGLSGEELAELLAVLFGGRRVPGDVGGAALEEVGHEDTVFLLVGGSENVTSLDGLVEETEDVVDDHDGLGGVRRAGNI